jgi:hypothetical protein
VSDESKRAMLAALTGMASRGKRSALDDRLPEGKRGGLTIIVMGGGETPEVQSAPEELEPEEEIPALEFEDDDEDDDMM